MEGLYIVLAFCVLILAFDGIWSYVAVRYKYNYMRGWWGSYLIYGLGGFVAARSGLPAAFAVGIVAFVESSFGTLLALRLGAYTKEVSEKIPKAFPFVIISQTALGAGVGFLVGLLVDLW